MMRRIYLRSLKIYIGRSERDDHTRRYSIAGRVKQQMVVLHIARKNLTAGVFMNPIEEIKFSILIPVYNTEAFLEKCLTSVLAQTYQNFEIVIVDDGSSDNSGAICDRYAEKDSRIHVFHQKNAGLMCTRDHLLSHVSGDYVVFVDSDDRLKRQALQTIADSVRHTDADLVIYGVEMVDGFRVLGEMADDGATVLTDKRQLYRRCLLTTDYNSLCRKAVRAGLFADAPDYSRWYKMTTGEDLIRSLHLFEACSKAAFIPDRLYEYVKNTESMRHQISFSAEDNRRMIFLRELVLHFLIRQHVFTEKDFQDFRLFCVLMLWRYNILSIAGSNNSSQVNKRLLNEIRNSFLYKNFLRKGRFSLFHSHTALRDLELHGIFYLLRTHQDHLLLSLASMQVKHRKAFWQTGV